MSHWYINPHCSENIQKIFQNIAEVLSLKEGTLVSSSSVSRVIRYSYDNKNYYIKHYFSRGKGLRKFFGRSKWKAECDNLIFCHALNIPVPTLIAYGSKNHFFRNFHGIIITEEVPDAIDLKKIAMHHPHIFEKKIWRREIIKIIATYVSLLHQHHFMHYDLQWRNILVTTSIREPKVYLFDMPSGRICKYFFSRMLKRDFFNLYKSAVIFLSRTDQLRFYLMYYSIERLTKKDKYIIKSLIAYYRRKEAI